MSLCANHLRRVLSTGALTLLAVGCRTAGTDGDGCADCALAPPPAVVRLDENGASQFDRPFTPPATSPANETDPPLRADSPADASHPEESGPTEPVAESITPPDAEIVASQFEARGARITHDPFQEVVTIDLSNSDVIDTDLEHLNLFESLEQLNLSGTRITNTAVDYITPAAELEFLGLTGTQIDDDGVRKIAELSQLRFLSLAGTDVTDAGLEALSRMRSLEALNLRSTLATVDGVAALQSRLPECRIVFEVREEISRPVDTNTEEAPAETGSETSWHHDPQPGTVSENAASGANSDSPLELTRLYPTPDHIAAQQRLELVLRRKLSDPEVLHALAALRAAEGNWIEARRTIRTALEQRPGDPGLRFDLAVTLAQCNELESAFNEFERAVGPAAAHYNLGVLLAEQERFVAGRRQFLEAVALDPSLDVAQDWLAYTEGDRLNSPHDAGGHGLLSNQELHSLFGSLLTGESSIREEIVIQPANASRPGIAVPVVQPASTAFRPIRTNPAQSR